MSALRELTEITNSVPLAVLQDVHSRIADWLSSGGSDDDPYIRKQLEIAKRFVEKEDK